jgi:HEPN domain-containing protein
MPNRNDLRKLARARIKDALTLFGGRRYDGALYLCGYAIEYALKARICTTLGWSNYPPAEKGDYRSFISHDFDHLLRLSSREKAIKTAHVNLWSKARTWKPELRYEPVGTVSRQSAREMIECARALLNIL